MGTIAAMWSSNPDSTRSLPGAFSICVLQATGLQAKCVGVSHNNSFPSPNKEFLALSGGGQFACGIDYGSHFLECWGDMVIPSAFQQVSYRIVASGGAHVCALRGDNSNIDCWGDIEQTPPRLAFASVISGWGFSCGLTREGAAICWGKLRQDIPQPINDTFRSIYAGGNTVCAVAFSWKLTCWGTSDHGQSNPPSGFRFLAITGGLYHTCGIRADTRQALCWGLNDQSQLEAPEDASFSAIAAGDFYTCGVRLDRPMQVVCWGNSVVYPQNATFSVSPAPCVSTCETGEFQFDQLSLPCPVLGDKVCVTCSLCMYENSPCGPDSDRKCGVHAYRQRFEESRSSLIREVVSIVVVSVAVLFLMVSLLGIYLRRRWNERHKVSAKLEMVASKNETEQSTARVVAMSPLELEAATNNYSDEMILGKGAFGTVYRGVLENGQSVAIKRAILSNRSTELFGKELKLLTRTHHSCLVNLVGYCLEEKVLVFEFMSRGTLYDNIFGESGHASGLNWTSRIKIATQAARGLEYLHKYACPTIIHRDVKSANILLDDEWNAHVSDFGLSLFGPLGSATHLSNMTIVGTPGYLDPEYGFSMKLTTKSDVYSFGVVLLELLSGQKPMDPFRPAQSIVAWAIELMEDEELHALLDPALSIPEKDEPLRRAVQLALRCTSVKSKDRPSISDAAKCLEEILEDLQEYQTVNHLSF